MPFCKRLVAPKDVCRTQRDDLRDVCDFALLSVLRQLSDLCRHAASIVDELDGELVSVCERSRTLQRKVGGLQKRVSAAVREPPPPKTATNLDSERERSAHFRSSWQQHANVFGSWSRPECVRELHEEARLNLHRLLQEFEEQLYGDKVTGQTFRPTGQPSSPSSEDTGQSSSRRPDFVFLARDGGTVPVGFPASDTGGGSPARPHLLSRSSRGPPVAEKPRWYLRCRAPARLLPADVTGDLSVPEETLGFDLIQGVHSAEPLGARLSMPSSETCSHHVPLRKSCSNLDEGTMEHAGLMCANPSWNGPKGSTFSPSSWNDSFSSFGLVPGPVASVASPEHATGTFDSPFKGSSGHSVSSGSHSSSFASIPTESSAKTLSSPPPEAESTRGVTDGPAKSAVEKGERRSSRAGAFQFRERSLSTPTDSDSFCSADNPSATETQPESESYAPRYPSGSSEEGTSVDSVSVAALDFMPDGRPRSRSRSISLKKPKKKPLPPVRSVSLKNSLSTKVTFGDGRPRSLIITSEHLQDFQPDFIMDSKQLQNMKDFSLSNRRRASDTQAFNKEVSSSISECKLPDPVTSTASLGTAKCAARSENHNAYGQLECPISFSASQATSHSKVSAQAESKISPIKPAGLMSPSSGYSSQSETPTPTIPTSVIMGPSPLGCKMRPKIPERKSSLPATSQGDRATRSRLSIELPVTSHLDFSSIKLKPKASRRHSDSSTANKPGQKLSPSQSMMPLVTQTDLRNVRLRSVCRSEPEDNTNASSDIIAEEKHPVAAPTLTPKPKTKPPVAVKPPLPKRPPNLSLKSHSVPLSSECQPATSRDLPKPVENIYRVVKKPRAKKQPQSPLRPESVEEACQHLQQQDSDNQQVPDHCAQSVSSGPEAQSYNRTLPSRVTISSLAELDRKWKVPPPVPKKPNIIFLPVSAFPSTVSAGRLVNPPGANTVPTCPAVSGKDENRMTDGVSPPDPEQHLHRGEPVSQASLATANLLDDSGDRSSEDVDHERSTVSTTEEEDYDDVFVQSAASHTTEDLFTIIHRSKRKVLGRKEPADHFGSRQSLTSPVKSSGDTRVVSLASTPRSSSRNDTFMALLQRKNSKANGAGRVSAMELLKSTNPLARRVTEFALTEPETAGRSGPPHDH
ncbi:Nance-Horan syndrome protein-like isoform X2 [Scleropages formosus]|uniref:Nance-Horan syndrome protein-like isoform X2 n=1 Tax=Scleropages formosus TaxID=113540 RepID=UPI0010FABCAC|nr:Nance-Horan syndrome protein-like isoform X2 [Scleropages formosus]